MNFIKKQDAATGTEVMLNYEDLGQGQPIVLIHGWPLSKEMWEYQVTALLNEGFRVITYDRRGFGKSSRPVSGYDYDTLADDLKAVLDQLNLSGVTLVGFSMGGGEVVRYFSRYGGARVTKVVLMSAVTPFLLKTEDNHEGVDQSVFDEMMDQMNDDRIGFLDNFGKQFFGVNMLSHPVSTPFLEYNRMLASVASPIATMACAKAFSTTDFRADLAAVNVPTLIIHGGADKTVPIDASGNRTAAMMPNSQYLVYDSAPHGVYYTHKDDINRDLIDFVNNTTIRKESPVADNLIL